MKNHKTATASTYTTDCMRTVTDPETGEQRVARMVETRAVSVTLVEHDKAVFFRGARVA